MNAADLQLLALGMALISKPARDRVAAMPGHGFAGPARRLHAALRVGAAEVFAALGLAGDSPSEAVLHNVGQSAERAKREADLWAVGQASKIMPEAQFREWVRKRFADQ